MHPDHHLNTWQCHTSHSHIRNKRNCLKNPLFLMRREKNDIYLQRQKKTR